MPINIISARATYTLFNDETDNAVDIMINNIHNFAFKLNLLRYRVTAPNRKNKPINP